MRKLIVSIPEENLVNLVHNQLNSNFPDHLEVNVVTLKHCVKSSILRIRRCFDPIILKYYSVGNESYFNHLHGDHYSMFLYFVSNEAYRANDEVLAAKLFLLNKSLFGIDAFYSIKLPEHFLFVHPLGTILGNARYEEFLVIYQGVTIGATTSGIYPTFSKQTILYSNSSIIGDCRVGRNFILAANASLVNLNVPANKVVVGNFPSHLVLENKNNLITNYFSF
jgi:serine O-acetyltransferase